MRGAERVVLALGALGEAGQAAALTQGADAVASPSEDLVRVGLMADVPDHTVARCVEHAVQGNRKLDHAEAGPEMAAGHRHRINGFEPQVVDQLAQILLGQVAHVLRCVHSVENGRLGGGVHGRSFQCSSGSPVVDRGAGATSDRGLSPL